MHEKETAYEAWLEPTQTYMMEFFCEISYVSSSLLFSQQNSIIDIWHGSKYASEPLR